MKRSLIILICLILILSFCACKSAASTGAQKGDEGTHNENTAQIESVGIPIPVSDVGSDRFDLEFIEVRPPCPPAYGITFQLPKDWVYEFNCSDDAPTSDLVVSIRPEFPGTKGSITLQHCDGFGVCGTGLEQKDIEFNGHPAWQGFYDGNPMWSFICLKDQKDCVIINSAENWYEKYEKEVDKILSTVEFVYYENVTSASEPEEIIIDSGSFDIDADGVVEDCTISDGPTSGLFTVVITASVNENIKYRNTFNLAWGELSFREKDGSLYIVRVMNREGQEPKTEYLKLTVEEGRIVLDGLDSLYEGYWGDSKWNYDQKEQSVMESDEQTPGTVSSDTILEGIVNWAKSKMGLTKSEPYEMNSLLSNDRAKAFLSDHKALIFEDDSIIGYCTYAVPQTVKSTDKGDVVTGDGVDFVESLIKAEANKLGKDSYTDSRKDRVFFIISDKNKLSDFIGFYMNSAEGNNKDPETLYSYWKTTRAKIYRSIEELADASTVIVIGECISAKPVYQMDMIYTLSEVLISECYKGDLSSGEVIQVVEMGGRDSYGEYHKHCFTDEKDFTVLTYPDYFKVVCGADGFWPMKEGEQVLLFLGDTTGFLKDIGGTLYDVVGDYDGKLYLQPDGTYKRPSPSETDHYIFEGDRLTADIKALKQFR